jgi:hypothetical protein
LRQSEAIIAAPGRAMRMDVDDGHQTRSPCGCANPAKQAQTVDIL